MSNDRPELPFYRRDAKPRFDRRLIGFSVAVLLITVLVAFLAYLLQSPDKPAVVAVQPKAPAAQQAAPKVAAEPKPPVDQPVTVPQLGSLEASMTPSTLHTVVMPVEQMPPDAPFLPDEVRGEYEVAKIALEAKNWGEGIKLLGLAISKMERIAKEEKDPVRAGQIAMGLVTVMRLKAYSLHLSGQSAQEAYEEILKAGQARPGLRARLKCEQAVNQLEIATHAKPSDRPEAIEKAIQLLEEAQAEIARHGSPLPGDKFEVELNLAVAHGDLVVHGENYLLSALRELQAAKAEFKASATEANKNKVSIAQGKVKDIRRHAQVALDLYQSLDWRLTGPHARNATIQT